MPTTLLTRSCCVFLVVLFCIGFALPAVATPALGNASSGLLEAPAANEDIRWAAFDEGAGASNVFDEVEDGQAQHALSLGESPAVVPEPETAALLAIGLWMICGLRAAERRGLIVV